MFGRLKIGGDSCVSKRCETSQCFLVRPSVKQQTDICLSFFPFPSILPFLPLPYILPLSTFLPPLSSSLHPATVYLSSLFHTTTSPS